MFITQAKLNELIKITKDAATKEAEATAQRALNREKIINEETIKALTEKYQLEIDSLQKATRQTTFSFQEQINALEESYSKITEKFKNALKPKIFEKELSNGNKLITKVNKNGAVMKTELTKDNNKVSCSVETLDGMVKRTTYNPITSKPVKTFSTSSGAPIEIKYDEKGRYIEKKAINAKKQKAEMPKEIPSTKRIKHDENNIITTVSCTDGTEITAARSKITGDLYSTIFSKDGCKYKEIYNNIDCVKTYTNSENLRTIDISYKNGIKFNEIEKTNELGITQCIKRTKYPKNTETNISYKKETYNCSGNKKSLIKEERKLQNGDLIKINFDTTKQEYKASSNFVYKFKVESIEIFSRNKKDVLSGEDALKYLKENEPPHVPINGVADKTLKHDYV